MKVVEAVRGCVDWRPEMEKWVVTAVGITNEQDSMLIVMDDGRIIDRVTRRYVRVEMDLTGPWKPEGAEVVHLSFEMSHPPPTPEWNKWTTVAGMDLLGCPAGAILVWDEHEVD